MAVDYRLYRDVLAGLVFDATLQLRTPLRVLLRDGELHPSLDTAPPQYAHEAWEGFWLPRTKSWKELSGADLPAFEPSTRASDIGQVSPDGRYLAFLMSVRRIVEPATAIEARRTALRRELARNEWAEFVTQHGGPDAVLDKFFPRFVDCLPVPGSVADGLWAANLCTSRSISTAPDIALLSVKGLGRARLAAVRARCATVSDPDAELVDAVSR